jgi:urea carboxylase
MPIEPAVDAPVAGLVHDIRVRPGRTLRAGDPVAVIEEA